MATSTSCQDLGTDFDVEAFKRLIQSKKAGMGLSWTKISWKSGQRISADTLSRYALGHRLPVRSSGWLCLIEVLGLTHDEVLTVDKRSDTIALVKTFFENQARAMTHGQFNSELERTISAEDLVYLLGVAKGLSKPLTLKQVLELLDKR